MGGPHFLPLSGSGPRASALLQITSVSCSVCPPAYRPSFRITPERLRSSSVHSSPVGLTRNTLACLTSATSPSPPVNARTRFARLATRSRAFAARNVNASPVPRPPLPLVAHAQRSPRLPLAASPSTPSLAPLARRTTLARSGERPLVIRPQTVSLALPSFRSALPFRLRCADSAQSGAATPSAPDVTALAEPRTAPSRCPNGATVVAADPRPGVTAAPPAPRPHSAPFRSFDRHRLLVCPAPPVRAQ